MSLILSFLGGVVSAFTPCVIVLMPILLYRFFHEGDKEWERFGLFVLGFLLFYVVFGYLLSSLFTSFVQNGLRFGLGLLFVVLGLLAVMGRLNPLQFLVVKNSFLLGSVFALIVSFNPCTIPYLGAIISIESNALLFLNLILFGLGLIVPAILFAVFGKRALNLTKKSGKIYSRVNYLMNYILILSGAYLIFSIEFLHKYDIYIVGAFLLLSFYILLKAFFVINKVPDILKLKNVLLLSSLVVILFAALFNCNSYIDSYDNINSALAIDKNSSSATSCGVDVSECQVCKRCTYIFGGATMLGFLGIVFFRFDRNGKGN